MIVDFGNILRRYRGELSIYRFFSLNKKSLVINVGSRVHLIQNSYYLQNPIHPERVRLSNAMVYAMQAKERRTDLFYQPGLISKRKPSLANSFKRNLSTLAISLSTLPYSASHET